MSQYRAYEVVEVADKQYQGSVVKKNEADLPDGELLIEVLYSSLNYKDALSASGNKGVTRHYPHVPGIDAVGTVQASEDAKFSLSSGGSVPRRCRRPRLLLRLRVTWSVGM